MSAVASSDPAISGMALGRSQTICRYYVRGICRFGELCRFSHDLSRGRPECEQPVTPEVLPKPSTSSSSSSQSASTSSSTQQRNWANAPVFVPSQKRNPARDQNESEATVGSDAQAEPGVGWFRLVDIGTEVVDLPSLLNNKEPGAGYVIITPGISGADVVGGPSSLNNKEAGAGYVALKSSHPASWAEVVGGPSSLNNKEGEGEEGLCPYESPYMWGDLCPNGIHMELCEMCDQYCLHPTDQAQRKKHKRECLQQHEQAMELSFAIARSKDKTCGICFDTIMEKAGREKRFGILPNCNHIFCLECIRTWRQAKQFEHKITRACPECRVCSDFVCPSAFWVETKEEKDKLLNDYRAALGAKDCKYFKKGEGKCPFGNKCFYKHALPNGDIVDVGLPKRTRKLQSQNEIIDLLDIYLWDYVDRRDYHWLEILSSDLSESSDFSDED
ncbi:probable E3 ubiquitin-protein ligase makorin-1 [Drosophila gunungcola]|uniref:RING-type E3 ubiquitin transferase n=1 Tax=Drosophila gunungcola TaxID=103775 RepID=A0A9Q0BRR5_9MUSC|nr:probable E3 ubiquitin-protein ligase makorin-1 [Drosophila gunungcola]KAI8041766.1 hypothetical protein M5D96_006035 [Drosophila gunungcola]